MRLSSLALFVMSATVPGQLGRVDTNRPVAITVHLGGDDTVSFKLSEGVVTEVSLHVGRADYSVPLQCAGGLHDVDFGTVELSRHDNADDSFALLFDMGGEQSRKFGRLPRVQLSFYRGRVTEMLVTTMTSERSAFSSKLCSS